MATGAVLVIIATFIQAFAPKGKIGVFIAGRVIIGLGQGLALSKSEPESWEYLRSGKSLE
jgi:MFS family permease